MEGIINFQETKEYLAKLFFLNWLQWAILLRIAEKAF